MTAPRRVLVHCNSLELGGTQINAVDLATAMVPHGYESVLVGPAPTRPGPSLLDVARERGVTVEPYEEPATVLAHARLLSRRADELAVDLVHAYGTWGAARSVYWGPCRLARRPWVLTMYEMSLHHSVHRRVPLVVGTEYLLEDCADRPGPTVLISPPVDMTRDRPPAVPPRNPRPTVVLVSRLEEDMKSVAVEAAVGAVHRLADLDVVLRVVGTGAAEGRLRTLGEKVNADLGRTAVVFTGPLADPRPEYAGADVVLGMGGSAARGLAHGKPVVVQGERGFSAVMTPESAPALARNSFWSPDPVADADVALAGHLRPLLTDAALRVRLGEFSRRFAEGRFGLTAMADRLAAVYEDAGRAYTPRAWAADLAVELRRVPGKLARTVRGE